MSLRTRSCLEDELSEYAAGRLSVDRTLRWDRHLVACETCRCDVAAERRLQAVLSGAQPALPDGLRSALLALAGSLPDGSVPPVPLAPFSLRVPPHHALPVVRPSAPALHRSALRSAMMATVVASASAAAAWGLAVTAGSATTTATGDVRPAPAVSSPGSPFVPVGAGSSGAAVVNAAFRWSPLRQPEVHEAVVPGAQSTP